MRKECQICFERRPKPLFPSITLYCRHQPNICETCVSRHISTQLDSKGSVEIRCLVDGCNQTIQPDDVKRINPNLFERFDALMLRQTLSKLPEFRWCKTRGCNSGQLHLEGDEAPIVTCQDCGQKSCYTHDMPWHEGLTCSEFDSIKQGSDQQTQDLLERETKQCPKCGVRITKNGGCDHMTCKVNSCRYEFCWLCLADYNEIRANGNRAHRTYCNFYQ